MLETFLATYITSLFLLPLHFIEVQLDEKHSISLLQLIALSSIGAKGIYYKD